MRSMWSGSIGFGMVHIPVKMYTAIREQEPKFKRWDPVSQSFPRQIQMAGDIEVSLSDLTKVYEIEKGHMVEITAQDLDKLTPESKHHLDVAEFVPLDSIDPLYFEKTYFLGPDKDADMAFTLLGKALAGKGSAAIVRITVKTKEHLAAIYVNRGVLCLSTMYYEAEVVAGNAIYHDLQDVADDALELACEYIDAMSSDCFDPSNYRDIHHDQVMAMIQNKAAGLDTPAKDVKVRKAPPADILVLLRTQLEARKVAA